MTKNIKLSPAFSVLNGKKYEVHQYEYADDGRRWERTTAGPFDSETDAKNAAEHINHVKKGEK